MVSKVLVALFPLVLVVSSMEWTGTSLSLSDLNAMQKRLVHGQESLARWEEEASTRACMAEVVQSMKAKCKQILYSETLRAVYAIRVANCHFKMNGFKDRIWCPAESPVRECLAPLEDPSKSSLHTTFSNDYQNVGSICYALENKWFQEHTEDLIGGLVSHARNTVDTLKKVSSTSEIVSKQLSDSAETQEKIKATQDGLVKGFKNMVEQEKKFFTEFTAMYSRLYDVSQSTASNVMKALAMSEAVGNSTQEIAAKQLEIHREQSESMQALISAAQQMKSSLKESLQSQEELQAMQVRLGQAVDVIGSKQDNVLLKVDQVSNGVDDVSNKQEEFKTKQREYYAETMNYLTNIIETSQKSFESLQENERIMTNMMTTVTRILRVDTTILRKFFTLETIIYYCASVVLALCMTTPVRLHSARPWIFTILFLSAVMEHYVTHHTIERALELEDVGGLVQHLRKVVWCLCAVCLIIAATTYKDIGKMNHEMIAQIHERVMTPRKEIPLLDALSGDEEGDLSPSRYSRGHGSRRDPKRLSIDSFTQVNLNSETGELESNASNTSMLATLNDAHNRLKKYRNKPKKNLMTPPRESVESPVDSPQENNENIDSPESKTNARGRGSKRAPKAKSKSPPIELLEEKSTASRRSSTRSRKQPERF